MHIHKNLIVNGSDNRPMATDIFYLKTSEPKPVVIYAHGFKGFKDWGNFDVIASRFASAGFTFIKFNFSHNDTYILDTIVRKWEVNEEVFYEVIRWEYFKPTGSYTPGYTEKLERKIHTYSFDNKSFFYPMPEQMGVTTFLYFYHDDTSHCITSNRYTSVNNGLLYVGDIATRQGVCVYTADIKNKVGILNSHNCWDYYIGYNIDLLYANVNGIECGRFHPLKVKTELQNKTVTFYPNPASTTLHLEIPKAKNSSVKLVNQMGQIVYSNTTVQTTLAINVAGYLPGIYYLSISNGNNTITKLISVQH